MSGSSYRGYQNSYRKTENLFSVDKQERNIEETLRKNRLNFLKDTVEEKKERKSRDESKVYDSSLIRLEITKPKKGTKRVHVFLIDNSGSNRNISNALKKASGYFTANIGVIDPNSQIAFIYFSDHYDEEKIMQKIDFVSPNEEGDKIIHSTLRKIKGASGGDLPEAIECVLHEAANIDFGDVKEKHLYLVTDVVAHGMGMDQFEDVKDDGCPLQRQWKKELLNAQKVYDSIKVVACGDDLEVVKLQEKFITDSKRLPYDLIDLSNIKVEKLRQGLTANALIFLIARNQGKQGVELFLCTLYEKWLEDPIFGQDTDEKAKDRIRDFVKYLEWNEKDKKDLLRKVFAE